MKKYLLPCAALMGIALLAPRVDAANLVIKSRAVPAGGKISVPVYATSISANSLWGIDAGLIFDNAALTAQAADAAFVPFVTDATDVVVTGGTFVGGGTQPSLYVGYVKGAAGYDSTKALGSLKLQVAAGTALKTLINITVPATYNVKNDGTGADVARAGATGVTSTATAGAPVVAETITLADTIAAGTKIVGQHKVVVTIPGDVDGNGILANADLTQMKAYTLNKPIAWTDVKGIAADVAPTNGYTPALIGGTNGFGYGDGNVNNSDVTALGAKLINKLPNSANFPVPE